MGLRPLFYMKLADLKFSTKEVIYIIAATVAYIGQLTHLSNKIDEYRYKTDLRLQAIEMRITPNEMAILPKELKLEGE